MSFPIARSFGNGRYHFLSVNAKSALTERNILEYHPLLHNPLAKDDILFRP